MTSSLKELFKSWPEQIFNYYEYLSLLRFSCILSEDKQFRSYIQQDIRVATTLKKAHAIRLTKSPLPTFFATQLLESPSAACKVF
jgi:hypothetical protein